MNISESIYEVVTNRMFYQALLRLKIETAAKQFQWMIIKHPLVDITGYMNNESEFLGRK